MAVKEICLSLVIVAGISFEIGPIDAFLKILGTYHSRRDAFRMSVTGILSLFMTLLRRPSEPADFFALSF